MIISILRVLFAKKTMKKIILLTISALMYSLLILTGCKKTLETDPNATQFVDNGDGSITVIDKGKGVGNYTFTSDKVWILEGFVFVNDGQTLTIEPGTLIKGKPGTGENASAIIVARGGKIMAEGTASKPIVFTALVDNYQGTGVDAKATGLWGGLIILGKATTNNSTNEKAIEGIPTNETRGLYGGSNDNDNSGVLKYISIRHGGTDIGEGNEINGLTLGAVGSATTIDFVEVTANKDDGVEIFGGAVNIKHIIISNCGDDGLDYDEGWHGKAQFIYIVQDENGDRCGEHDGGPSDNELGTPYSTPEIYNATYIGGSKEGTKIVIFRDNSGGTYANSIFVSKPKGIDIEYKQDANNNLSGCSYKMWTENKLHIKNNIFYNINGVDENTNSPASKLFGVSVPKDANGNALYSVPSELKNNFINYFDQANNKVVNVLITAQNPIPTNPQTTDLAAYPTTFFENVNYKGAFGSSNWANGWTLFFKNSK